MKGDRQFKKALKEVEKPGWCYTTWFVPLLVFQTRERPLLCVVYGPVLLAKTPTNEIKRNSGVLFFAATPTKAKNPKAN